MFSYPGVHGMLMVHVGANIRDDMNLRAPMFPWAFEKEQRKGRRQSKKGVVVDRWGTHMDRDKGFCCGLPSSSFLRNFAQKHLDGLRSRVLPTTYYTAEYWLIRPHSVLSSSCPIALLLSFSPQSLTLSDQSFLIIDRLFYCLDVRLSLRA